MKRLALIGSGSSETTRSYLGIFDRETSKHCGVGHSADIIAILPNASRLIEMCEAAEWTVLNQLLESEAHCAVAAGVDAVLLGGSALNPLAESLNQTVGRPVLALAPTVRNALRRFRFKRAGILGIRSDREAQMWCDALGENETLFAGDTENRRLIEFAEQAADRLDLPEPWYVEAARIVSTLRRAGAQAIVLCIPELNQLLREGHMLLPVFDAGETHAWAAMSWALGGEGEEVFRS